MKLDARGCATFIVVMMLALLGWPAAAHAKGPAKIKVHITSEPAGATVFEGSADGKKLGVTPFDTTLTAGQVDLVFVLDGYVDKTETVTVPAKLPAKQKKLDVAVKLEQKPGTLVFTGKPATVNIDGEDVGRVPMRYDIAPGEHKIQIITGGNVVYDSTVTVVSGVEQPIELKVVDKNPGGVDGEGGGGGDEPGGGGKAVDHSPKWRVGVTTEVGLRRSTYTGGTPNSAFLRKFTQNGAWSIGIDGEARLWANKKRVFGMPAASLWVAGVARFGIPQEVLLSGFSGDLSTSWHTFAGGLYYHRMIKKTDAHLGLDVANERRTFSGDAGGRDASPDVAYTSIRPVVGAAFGRGALRPYLDVGVPLVVGKKPLAGRYDSASVFGYELVLGARYRLGKKGTTWLHVEGALEQFFWSLTPETGSDFDATKLKDTMASVRIGIDYGK